MNNSNLQIDERIYCRLTLKSTESKFIFSRTQRFLCVSTCFFLGFFDAMGAPCEFNAALISQFDGNFVNNPEWIFKKRNHYGFEYELAHGQVTDDTEMMLACLNTIAEGYTRINAVKKYHQFVNSGTYCLGRNTRALLHGYKKIEMYSRRYAVQFATKEAIEQSQLPTQTFEDLCRRLDTLKVFFIKYNVISYEKSNDRRK